MADNEVESIQWNEVWQQALAIIASKLSKPSYDTWFARTTVQGSEHELTIVSEEKLKSEWLEVRYLKLINETVSQLTKNPGITFKFITR